MQPKSLTVVQMLPDLESGGVERGTLEVGAYLARCGHRSIVVSAGGRLVKQLENEGSRHVTLPVGSKTLSCLPTIFQIRKLLLREKVNILHLRSRLPAWVGYIAIKSLPATLRPHVVTTFHGFYSINRYSAVMTKGEAIIAISNIVAKHIQTHYQVPESRIRVIYRGIDERFFTPEFVDTGRIETLKKQWGLSGNSDPVLLLPGRITGLKGHEVFINSLAQLRHLPWHAVCVGDIENKTGFQKSLRHLAERMGLEGRVRFAGYCTDMPAAYMASDISVSASSSEAEAFGRVAVEAQAMGKPIVATAHGGSLETVLDGQTGWLVPPGNPKAMAMALGEAITNPAKRVLFGKNGRRWVRAQFSTKEMCEKTVQLYNSLIKKQTAVTTGYDRTAR